MNDLVCRDQCQKRRRNIPNFTETLNHPVPVYLDFIEFRDVRKNYISAVRIYWNGLIDNFAMGYVDCVDYGGHLVQQFVYKSVNID